MANDLSEMLFERNNRLKEKRQLWEPHWQELADYILPRRATFNVKRSQGEKRTTKMFDSTAPWALEMFASGLQGFLTNPAQRWFALRTDDPELMRRTEVREWVQDVENRMYAFLAHPRVKFYPQSHELYLDLGAFGTGVMFAGENQMFRTFHLGECSIAENEFGFVDTLFREFDMPVRNILTKWGVEKAGPKILEMYEKTPTKELTLVHATFPRHDFDPLNSKLAKRKRFASVYFWPEKRQVFGESGFDDFPYFVPRWYTATGETYGRGPGTGALPDIKMLNEMEKTTLKGAQKMVDPPLQVPDDGFMAPIRMTPAALNYKRAGTPDKIEPIITGGNIGLGLDMTNQKREAIIRAFFVDQLQDDKRAEMTATETLQRAEDRLRNMSPQLGRLHVEYLQPLLERVFTILLRGGKFAPAPAVLDGRNLDIVYISPLARAQKTMQAANVQRMLEAVGAVAGFKPEVLDRIDGDGMAKWFSDLYDVPEQVLADEETMQAMRQQRQQAEQAAQAAEIANTASGAVKNVLPLIQQRSA